MQTGSLLFINRLVNAPLLTTPARLDFQTLPGLRTVKFPLSGGKL